MCVCVCFVCVYDTQNIVIPTTLPLLAKPEAVEMTSGAGSDDNLIKTTTLSVQ